MTVVRSDRCGEVAFSVGSKKNDILSKDIRFSSSKGLGREKVRSPSDFIPPSIDAIKSFLRATEQKSTTLLYDKQSVTVCFHHSPAT